MEANKKEIPAPTPDGVVNVDEAMRMFGVSRAQLRDWEFAGRICNVRWIRLKGGGRDSKLYPVAELRRVVEETRAAAEVAKRWDRRVRGPGGLQAVFPAGRVVSTELTAGDAGHETAANDAR